MKKILLLSLFLSVTIVASTQDYNWATAVSAPGGASKYVEPFDNCVDVFGNTYATGLFIKNVDFSPSITITSNGNSRDMFLMKYLPSGTVSWVVGVGAPDAAGMEQANAVASDADGNVYMAGHYVGTVDFGPDTVTANGMNSFFIAKYDSAGNCLWVIDANGGGTTSDITSLIVDNQGYLIATGGFAGSAIDFGGTTLDPGIGWDAFVAKYTTSGNLVWVTQAGDGGWFQDNGDRIACDPDDNYYLLGKYSGTAYFGQDSLVTSGFAETFIAKLDSSGSFQWAITGIDASSPSLAAGKAITADNSGNVFVGGTCPDQTVFTSGTFSTTNVAGGAFLSKYNTNGVNQWVIEADVNTGVAILGSSVNDLSHADNDDIYAAMYSTDHQVLVYDNNGNVKCKDSLGSIYFNSIYYSPMNVAVSGMGYGSPINFGTISLNVGGNSMLNASWQGCSGPSSIEENEKMQLEIYPNPANTCINIVLTEIAEVNNTILLTDLSGRIIKKEKVHKHKASISIDDLANGVYLVSSDSALFSPKKIIIQH